MARNRQFLMLATDFIETKHRVAGCYMSEKLDGMRAVWIPKVRGMKPEDVPFLNMEKKKKNPSRITGLFSRYGNVVFAPDAFLDQLPKDMILDGELNFGRGGWKKTMETVKDHEPGPDWANVKFSIFDSPTPAQLFTDGRINETSFKKTISWIQAKLAFGFEDDTGDNMSRIYEFTRSRLLKLPLGPNIEIIPQILLPFNGVRAAHDLKAFYADVVAHNGEGVILRFASSEWEPYRSQYMFKLKAEKDSEGTIIGFKMGEGKYQGMLGSMKLAWGNTSFDLSGFTDAERELKPQFRQLAPEVETTENISAVYSLGQVINFKYRELSADGKPKEGRFHREVL